MVTEQLPPPNELEFEKVYVPYLLLNKKRYAGPMWEPKLDEQRRLCKVPETYSYVDVKGLELVRRDACNLTGQVQKRVLDILLLERDEKKAARYIKDMVYRLYNNRVDMSKLVVSRALTKNVDDYGNKQPHVEVAKKMMAREPSTAPTKGARVPYIMVKRERKAKVTEKAEHPLYALKHNLAVDAEHYINNQLRKPISRIMMPVMGRKKDGTYIEDEDGIKASVRVNVLFEGPHTLRRAHVGSAPVGERRENKRKRGMFTLGNFFKTSYTCLQCKRPIQKNNSTHRALCQTCTDTHAPRLFARYTERRNKAESDHARLWNTCLRCQKTKHRAVRCNNMDCPIWYLRSQRGRDIEDLGNTLKRFTQEW